MDRKKFLGASVSLIAGMTMPFDKSWASVNGEEIIYRKPLYLNHGDFIGITSPAGYITAQELKPAISLMESWGYKIKIGNAIGKRDFTRGGTISERLADLQQMLDDPKIKAIMCARGGYGSISIIDELNWTKFKIQPKWVIGF